MQTYFQLVQYIKNELSGCYQGGEINAFISIIFKNIENLETVRLHMKYEEMADDNLKQRIIRIVEDLKKQIPIQYILKEAWFYDLPFYVAPGALIPRPETEELVSLIINDNKDEKDIRILDIGTGSGCIAITLRKNLKCKEVVACEISRAAIKIAKKNNKNLKAGIKIKRMDILKKENKKVKTQFDIIVSNPPYVIYKEKAGMQKNVLDNEPHIALFVPDDDPLIFYKAIGSFASNNLKPGGKLYLEINENFGTCTFNTLFHYNFSEIGLLKDINGKDRMIRAIL